MKKKKKSSLGQVLLLLFGVAYSIGLWIALKLKAWCDGDDN